MHHSVPSASVSMCQMRSASSVGAYSSMPSGCSSTWPSESTKSSGAVAVIETPRSRAERETTLEEPANESLFPLRVRRVRELRVDARRLHQDALSVAEHVEARLAVVGAHAAGSDATEGQLGQGDVEHGRVDAGATGAGFGEHTFLHGARLREHVQGERTVPLVHEPDRLVRV